MTELFQNSLLTAGEDLRSTPILDEPDHEAPAFPASSGTTPTLESPSAETQGPIRTATDTTNGQPSTVNVESGPAENVDGSQPNKLCTPQKPVRPSPDNRSVAVELHTQMKQIIAGRTNLPDHVSAQVALWAISTWFQEVFLVIPCLVITGPAHEAIVLLRVLHDLCRAPALLVGFKKADLKDLSGYRTLLISEPNLDNRTAALLGNLTNRGFILLEQGSYLSCTGSRAIYIGEDPEIKRIQHSIYIDVTTPPPHADPPAPGQSLPGTIASLRKRLLEYRDRNLDKVCSLEFNPHSLSPEAHAVANALGSCLVDAPQLQAELVGWFRPQDQQQIADRSDSIEALVAGAALTFCHQGIQQVFVKEIAAEVNRLLEARGETMQFSPAKVGHKLRKVGLLTRRLSQAGNGLALDQATRIYIHEVAAAYRGEDTTQGDGNLHCPLCAQNEYVREVM